MNAELQTAFFAAIGTAFAVSIGWKKGFFRAPKGFSEPQRPPTFLLLFGAFFIYLGLGAFVAWVVSKLFLSSGMHLAHAIGGTFLISLSILAALLFYLALIAAPIRRELWEREGAEPPRKCFLLALAGWLIAFPSVVLLSSLLEAILFAIRGVLELPDQTAVLFLKMSFGHPLYFTLAFIVVVVIAPCLEELLFRGFLQNYLRRYFSVFPSIAIASLFFTAFHFSTTQQWANLPILTSLFVLGYFLGYLYERQRSLSAPLFLHAIFNAFSVANLYFWDTSF